jgi:hypothetical protein
MRGESRTAACLIYTLWLAASFASTAIAQGVAIRPRKPLVGPVFDERHGGPAFRVECRNPLRTSVEPSDPRWIEKYRIDGTSARPEGGVASILAPPPPIEGEKDPRIAWMVAPNATWQGMLALVQPNPTGRSDHDAASDSEIRTSLTIAHPLTPGRHTIAVQCFDTWSDNLAFWLAP